MWVFKKLFKYNCKDVFIKSKVIAIKNLQNSNLFFTPTNLQTLKLYLRYKDKSVFENSFHKQSPTGFLYNSCSATEVKITEKYFSKVLDFTKTELFSDIFKNFDLIFSRILSAIFHFWKIILFHLKSFFRSRDIQTSVFPSSPFFFVGHCSRGWSKMNLKANDVINCLNKNLTHFVWYLEKEKRYDMETLSINRVPNTEHFYRKVMRKDVKPKYSPRPPFS